jgi:hypothetical protein
MIDGKPPTVRISVPGRSASFALGRVVHARYACSDALAGVVLCRGSVADGQPLDTSTPGPHTFTVLARDAVGNVVTVIRTYTVGSAPS